MYEKEIERLEERLKELNGRIKMCKKPAEVVFLRKQYHEVVHRIKELKSGDNPG